MRAVARTSPFVVAPLSEQGQGGALHPNAGARHGPTCGDRLLGNAHHVHLPGGIEVRALGLRLHRAELYSPRKRETTL